MKIVVNGYGNKLSLKEDTIVVSNMDSSKAIPIDCISEILICNSCLLSSDIMHKCIINKVKLTFIDKYGRPYIFMESLEDACSPIIKRKQLILNKTKQGVEICKSLIDKKLENRQRHLKEIAKNRKYEIKESMKISVSDIQKYRDKIVCLKSSTLDDIRATIQAYEGNAGKIYFAMISSLLKPKYKFKTRSYKPAYDGYNCLLNYCYGIMYNKIKDQCIDARLDPYIGIMHVDAYNKPTLIYDLIEPYRYYCEKVVFKLLSKSMIKEDMFDIQDDEYILNYKGKQVLIAEYYLMMDKKVKLNRKSVTISAKIKAEILSLSKIIGELDIC